MIVTRQRGQRFSGRYYVIAPPEAHIGRDARDGGLVVVAGSGRKMQFELAGARSGHAQQAGVQILQLARG